MFDLPLIGKGVMSIAGAVGVIWGGMVTLDSRYEMKEVHGVEHTVIQTGMDNFSITVLKKEIREIRALLRTVTDQDYRQSLEDDLQDAINRLCQVAPSDRECK